MQTPSSWSRNTWESSGSPSRWTGFELEALELRPGFALLRLIGKGVERYVGEAGAHRWQRVPPTERHDRTHTSTITVATLAEVELAAVVIRPEDVEEQFTRGSGCGGQHRNKTSTAVILRHKPTGEVVRVQTERSQFQNRCIAMKSLRARLLQAQTTARVSERNSVRREHVGSGQRGDKDRTIQVKHDRVVQHSNGRMIRYKEYAQGRLSGLWT